MHLVFTLGAGRLLVRLFRETAPAAVEMVTTLAAGGYYTGLVWTRGEAWLETGCPVGRGVGTVAWMLEYEGTPDVRHVRGAVSLAPFGGGLMTCRLRFLLDDRPDLDGQATVVGQLVQGFEVLDRLAARLPDPPPRTLQCAPLTPDSLVPEKERAS